MRALAATGIMLAVAACGDDRAHDGSDATAVDANDANDASTLDGSLPDATPDALTDAATDASNTSFDLDIVVYPQSVHIWVREMFPSPCDPDEHFVRPGACELISDFHPCSGNLETCFQRMAVERNGVELARANLTYDSIWWSAATIYSANNIFAGGDLDLVIEGCGGNLTLPLSRSTAPPAPVATDFLWGANEVRGTVQPTGAGGTYADAWYTVFGHACHDAVDNAWHLPAPSFAPAMSASISAVVEQPAVTTPWGQARIWLATPEGVGRSIAIYGGDATRHAVTYVTALAATMMIDSTPIAISSLTWGFQMTPGGRRIYASTTGANALDYQAGATADTLAVARPNGRYTGTFPHVTPSNDMDFALDGDDRLALAFGPVTLTHETNPSLTIQVSLDLSLQHPILPRIVP